MVRINLEPSIFVRFPADRQIFTMILTFWVALVLVFLETTNAFNQQLYHGSESVKKIVSTRSLRVQATPSNEHELPYHSVSARMNRRQAFASGLGIGITLANAQISQAAEKSGYIPAKRATAYRVDSTIPPTLLSLDATKEKNVLEALGRGSGTDKQSILVDTVNLNNILNKAVFGTINAISGGNSGASKSGPGYASFVCFGVPKTTTSTDIELAKSLLQMMVAVRKSKRTALGLSICPYSTQPALSHYVAGGSEEELHSALQQAGVAEETIQLYTPLLQFAKVASLDLVALAPEIQDLQAVRLQGLGSVDAGRRSQYVIDTEGFISLTNNPKFKVYTDRSLFKDYTPVSEKDSAGNFFAERILFHEAAATAAATYATQNDDSLLALVAPIPDLRFLQGINGRIPRICRRLNPETKINDDAVTTILLNPTAQETLSKSRYLRLEIGTSPETLDYQSKVADYLWFSSTPKVNLIPRLME